MFNSLGIAVLVLRPDLTILRANPAAEQLIGLSARRMEGRGLGAIVRFESERLAGLLAQGDAQIAAHGVATSFHDSALRQIDFVLSPVTGFPGWQLLSMHDTGSSDSLRDTEDLPLRAPAILAHEIKNPLSAIRGAAQLISRKLPDKDKPMAKLIAEEVDRIAKLVDRMQRLGREKPEPVAPCNLHQVLHRARELVEAAGLENVRLTEEFDPSLPPVLANQDSLVQVLINLICNARDACKDGEHPEVTLGTRFVSGFVLNVMRLGRPIRLPIEIRVSDNGPGVPRDLRDHIFEPFVTSKKNGQGLGLALVNKLVRDMNGRITHERDEVHGWTHFRIHLPMVK
ncbi:PAS domain-containing sensor histidine kinase [Altererythrobacter endophyticus]|uniref:histidine kinase n=1 Tax=Altericroceibacterium endophyticum TaxID=1808508 RepID=A0A6I4T2Y0_9SPHN|nr:ATP-binding protein [Altericroceibacterium endophyticum]MXO64529.1 PAS domain-containing sensor histidine kinase [Altericroceibacterium endophyticum]